LSLVFKKIRTKFLEKKTGPEPVMGDSFILFYEILCFCSSQHLRESNALPNTGFPVLFICGTATNTHVFEKRKKREPEVDHRLTTDSGSRIIKTGPVSGVIFITRSGFYC
jgi:hypothetical protein